MSRSTVFVGNIHYDVTEDELRSLFETIGHVNNFRFVMDKETGKPRGFGFCEYQTEEQALRAIETLNDYEINGRNIKVDSADGNQDGSGQGPRGLGRQQKDIDKAIEQAGLPQIYDIIVQMKAMIQHDYPAAVELLRQHPVLAQALMKSLIALNAASNTQQMPYPMQQQQQQQLGLPPHLGEPPQIHPGWQPHMHAPPPPGMQMESQVDQILMLQQLVRQARIQGLSSMDEQLLYLKRQEIESVDPANQQVILDRLQGLYNAAGVTQAR